LYRKLQKRELRKSAKWLLRRRPRNKLKKSRSNRIATLKKLYNRPKEVIEQFQKS